MRHHAYEMENRRIRRPIVLLVIDMQTVAFDGKITPPIANGKRLLCRVADLIRNCRENGIRIVYVQTCAASGQPYSREAHGWDIHPLVLPQKGDTTVFKPLSSGFDGTDLEDVLDRMEAETLITCGIWSEHCLANTSRDARELGFEVVVAADAHGTVAESESEADERVSSVNLEMSASGIRVLSIGRIVQELFAHRASSGV